MTPALGLFYGGMVKTKNMISILAQCFAIYSITSLTWTLIGFSLVFGNSFYGLLGDGNYIFLKNVSFSPNPDYGSTIPFLLFYFFQTKFAVISPALIIGATAERIRFSVICLFSFIWTIIVYCPIAHWNWNSQGWLFLMGVKDFAGGNAIHISAGVSALAIVLELRDIKASWTSNDSDILKKDEIVTNVKRTSYIKLNSQDSLQEGSIKDVEKKIDSKTSLIFVVVGTMLLWFGWFGFNGGSALNSGDKAMISVVNSNLSASMALITWMILDIVSKGRPTIIGMCVGAVCGLVGITPGAGFVKPYASLIIGVFSSISSFYFCALRERYKLFDDRLDVFGCHGVSAIWGGIATGIFMCDFKDMNDTCDNNSLGTFLKVPLQIIYQIFGLITSIGFSFVMSSIMIRIMKRFIRFTYDKKYLINKGMDKLELHEYAMMTEFTNKEI